MEINDYNGAFVPDYDVYSEIDPDWLEDDDDTDPDPVVICPICRKRLEWEPIGWDEDGVIVGSWRHISTTCGEASDA